MPTYTETDTLFTTAVANVVRVINENRDLLEIPRDIYDYDEMTPIDTPCAAVVFQEGHPTVVNIGNNGRCRAVMNIHLVVYYYMEALSLGQESINHVARLSRMAELFFKNNTLFGLCHTEPLVVNTASLIGRRLESDIYLTGEVDLTVPIRFCADGVG